MALEFSGYVTCWNAYAKDYVVDERKKKNNETFGLIRATTSSYDNETKQRRIDSSLSLMFFGVAYEQLRQYDIKEKDVIYIKKGFLKNIYDKKMKRTTWFFTVLEFCVPSAGESSDFLPKEPEIIGNSEEEYIGDLPF